MEEYKKKLCLTLANTGSLFFDRNLVLKDGRPTPYFVNMGRFNTGGLLLELGGYFSEMLIGQSLAEHIDIIVGPSYKGSSIAAATVMALYRNYGYNLLFDFDRKKPKDHGESSSYAALFVNNAFFDKCRIFIVDDVATSMGTKYELIQKISDESKNRGLEYRIVGMGIVVDREQTGPAYDKQGEVIPNKKGPDPIGEFISRTGIAFFSVAGIREIVEYIYTSKIRLLIGGERKLMDKSVKREFDKYMEIYGR